MPMQQVIQHDGVTLLYSMGYRNDFPIKEFTRKLCIDYYIEQDYDKISIYKLSNGECPLHKHIYVRYNQECFDPLFYKGNFLIKVRSGYENNMRKCIFEDGTVYDFKTDHLSSRLCYFLFNGGKIYSFQNQEDKDYYELLTFYVDFKNSKIIYLDRIKLKKDLGDTLYTRFVFHFVKKQTGNVILKLKRFPIRFAHGHKLLPKHEKIVFPIRWSDKLNKYYEQEFREKIFTLVCISKKTIFIPIELWLIIFKFFFFSSDVKNDF
jgi:hypothetical protein